MEATVFVISWQAIRAKKRNVVSERKAKVNRDLSQHYSFTKPFFHVLEIGDVPNKG